MPMGTGRANRAVIRRRGATNLAGESLKSGRRVLPGEGGWCWWAPATHRHSGTSTGTHSPQRISRMPIGMWMASSVASAMNYCAVVCWQYFFINILIFASDTHPWSPISRIIRNPLALAAHLLEPGLDKSWVRLGSLVLRLHPC